MAGQHSKYFRNFDPIGGQIVDPVTYAVPDQSQPSFVHAMIPAGGGDGCSAWQPRMKRPKEEILESPPMSSLDFFKIEPVCTGLGLSLDNPNLASSSGQSSSALNLLSAVNGDIFDREAELQRMDAEMDSFIRLQGENLRKSILEKVHLKQIETLASFEEKFVSKIREKQLQIEEITKKNTELEDQYRQLSHESNIWQQQAKNDEDTIAALQSKCQQVHAQIQANKRREGCGDSEVDSAPGLNRAAANLAVTDFIACKVCGVNEMCMLILPCRHLCLCRECEAKLGFCPICRSSKFFGVEVYM